MNRRTKAVTASTVTAAAPDAAQNVGISLETPTRVFISYRREDTAETVALLHSSLEKVLGKGKIFRDVDTIQPGQNFETIINEAIRSTSVCLVVIGPSWLNSKGPSGKRRLDSRNDFVRKEIESALQADVEVIPLLVDGVKMPGRKQLPESIARLAVRNAYELPWISSITRLSGRIEQIERQRQAREAAERAERDRLDLTGGKTLTPGSWKSQSAIVSFNVVVRAMEISLARRGYKVWLSTEDFAKSYERLTNRSLDEGFFTPEIIHLVDFVGVKAKKSNRRYVARSYPLKTFADVPGQLALGRPVLVEMMVQNSWFKAPIMKTGLVDLNSHDQLVGGVLGAILGWDPLKQYLKVLSPWSTWGNHGMAMFTRRAAEAYLHLRTMHSIETVLMPAAPFRSTAGTKKDPRRQPLFQRWQKI
jgi:TIR domain